MPRAAQRSPRPAAFEPLARLARLDPDAAARAVEHARSIGTGLGAPHAELLVGAVGATAAAVLPALLHRETLVGELASELAEHGVISAAYIAPPSRDETAGRSLAETKRHLRTLRHEALARTALRELAAVADVDATAREWSRVASGCIALALAAAEAHWVARHGAPVNDRGEPIPACVLGMGKLGGGELNLGSDVDVCFFYGTDEGSVGDGSRTVHEHFARVASLTTELLGDVTEDGFAFRVDLRLRPEGGRGPLANSLASAERYYETWGRAWERAALVRARPVAGDPAFGRALLDVLRPFVFRRSVDPSIARSVAEMLEKARREQLRDDARDLKLGRGGIREAEFFVQSLQLVWGGRHTSLQVAHTLEAAAALRALGLLSHREARAFADAWSVLRRVEHRVQSVASYATHLLPDEGPAREVLARSLGYRNAAGLDAALARARGAVAELFASVSPGNEGASAGESTASPEQGLCDAVASGAPRAALSECARRVLFVRDGDGAADDLGRLARRADLPLGAVGRERFPALGPRLLSEIRDAPDADRALSNVADLFARLRSPESYARRLAEAPEHARGLVGLFGASDTLSRTLLARPELLDAVVTGGANAPSTQEISKRISDAEGAYARAAEAGGEAPTTDPIDATVGALRRVMREVTLELGIADMAGALRTGEVTARLSALAEGVVRACFELAAREARERFGAPEREGSAAGGPLDGLCVIAMGSLAARELGYGGDVDLLVLHDLEGQTSGGRRAGVSAPEYVARIAQRALTFLSAPHAEGEGYAADTRLRPSGAQGTLVSSLEGFARYHARGAGRAGAAPWERQALLRARACAGDPSLCARVQALVEQIAYEQGPADLDAVRVLRTRMERELGAERGDVLALKYGPGGLVDVEFAAQVLQMTHGTARALRTPVTRDALLALESSGLLDARDAAALLEGEALLRRALLASRLVTGRSTLLIGHPSTETVARTLGYRALGEQTAEDRFVVEVRAQRSSVRAAFDRVVPAPAAAQ